MSLHISVEVLFQPKQTQVTARYHYTFQIKENVNDIFPSPTHFFMFIGGYVGPIISVN